MANGLKNCSALKNLNFDLSGCNISAECVAGFSEVAKTY